MSIASKPNASAIPAMTLVNAPVTRLFEHHAACTPDAPAILSENTAQTYQDVNHQANQLAHILLSGGIGSERVVAIHLQQTPLAIVAQIAVMKAGGVCMPIPEQTPTERIRFMLADSRADLVLTQTDLSEPFEGLDVPTLNIDTLALDPATPHGDLTAHCPTLDECALIFYTSGSTGRPKGVQVLHRGIRRLVIEPGFIEISRDDCFAQISNVGFDAATFEIWGALANGARLAIIPSENAPLRTSLKLAFERYQISVIFLSASVFNLLVNEDPALFASIRWVSFGGEKADVSAVRRVLAHGKPAHLVNGYGPTECTTFSVCYEVPPDQPMVDHLPIGRPISRTKVHVVDERLQPVPLGGEGEILIGGDGNARGYLNRPELTAERFIPNHLDGEGTLYRTGDYGRWLPDGNLEYIGRRDQQVKLRGYRVELGEIELALKRLPQVEEAAVVLRDDARGKELAAFWTRAKAAAASDLREALKAVLPGYAIPKFFVELTAMPLNRNGKLDRMALTSYPLPTATHLTESARTETERCLLAIWHRVLHNDRLGVSDDFVDSGGDSLLAAQIMAKVEQQWGLRLGLDQLGQHRTVRSLAAIIDGKTPRSEPRSLIKLQSQGQRPPLFFFAGIEHIPFYALQFADPFAPETPVYGVPLKSERSKSKTFSIEELATEKAAVIIECYPQGPYFLCGFSMGGIVALEVAKQLVLNRRKVELLCLLDTLPPTRATSHKIEQHIQKQRFSQRLLRLVRMHPAQQWHRLKGCLARGVTPQPRGSRSTWASRKSRLHAYASYRVSGCAVPTVVFEAADRISVDQCTLDGWRDLIEADVEIVRVPGNHTSMFEGANLDALTTEIKRRLLGQQSSCTPAPV